MKRLEDYLRPAPKYQEVWWLALVVILGALALCAAIAYQQYQDLRQQELEIVRLRQANHVEPPPKPTQADLDSQKQWDTLRQELGFSWFPIFSALEYTNSQGIALLEFIPDKPSGRMVLRGNARNIDELTAYLDALSGEAIFREVYLAHQKKVQQNGVEVIFFEMRMRIVDERPISDR